MGLTLCAWLRWHGRITTTSKKLESLNVRLSEVQATEVRGEITYEEVELSLRFTNGTSSPGLDGIPFEVWKTLHARHREDSRFPE